jgi:hypothetical protein
MNHPSEYACGILDRLTASELDFAGGKEERLAPEFTDANLEADAGPCRGLGEEQSPAFAGKWFVRLFSSVDLEFCGEIESFENLWCSQRLDGEEMLHEMKKERRE